MKNRNSGGYSLVEILVAIALLGIVVVPTCSSLITAFRVNVKSEQMLQEQLAVSSAVETLMAEGITKASDTYDIETIVNEETGETYETDRFPGVTVKTYKENAGDLHFTVIVTSEGGISVQTCIRPALAMPADTIPTPSEGGAE